jgi:hypothetical protein
MNASRRSGKLEKGEVSVLDKNSGDLPHQGS